MCYYLQHKLRFYCDFSQVFRLLTQIFAHTMDSPMPKGTSWPATGCLDTRAQNGNDRHPSSHSRHLWACYGGGFPARLALGPCDLWASPEQTKQLLNRKLSLDTVTGGASGARAIPSTTQLICCLLLVYAELSVGWRLLWLWEWDMQVLSPLGWTSDLVEDATYSKDSVC